MELALNKPRGRANEQSIARDASDDELMRRVQDDDPEAFARLYDRYAVRAYRGARSVCFDTGRAEDAVQEGFLSIWRSRTSYRREAGSFPSWAMTAVRNRALDSLRHDAAVKRPEIVELNDRDRELISRSPQDALIAHSENDAILRAVRELPAAQAEVITLAFFGELTHPEIAAQLALPRAQSKDECVSGWRSCAGRWTDTARSSRSS